MKINVAEVRFKVIENLGADSIDPAAMADECWPGVSNPNLDATHDFWRILDEAAREFGYVWNNVRMLYVQVSR
jgi:hypothetical protein